ncbi:ABC transporter permease [Dyella sp. ASV21]|uniref:ABC transporter permease n=1 Tax=Dyella sp. ASV21 TaxID=2795114 RepID=UPI0018ECC57E|nr:ABC transporter permease [Dyella sp. ASV21]
MTEMLAAIWRYRFFIFSSVRNDFRARFARSSLGAIWMILQPLAQVAIYALVLSRVLGSRLPGTDNKYAYVIYLTSGILAWSLFVELLSRCLTIFVDNGNLLKKVVFPRICLPLILAGSALINNLLLLIATLGVFLLVGHSVGPTALWLLVLVPLTLAFALGLGLILGTLNVFVRDVAQVMNVVLQLWFWLTPVVYMPTIVPEEFKYALSANPMYWIVSSYQNVLLFHTAPDMEHLGLTAVISLGLLAVALLLFRRSSAEMVDVL